MRTHACYLTPTSSCLLACCPPATLSLGTPLVRPSHQSLSPPAPMNTSPRLPDIPRGSASRFAWAQWMAIAAAIVLVLLPGSVLGYIPAQATNETDVAQQAGFNFSDVSKLSLQWYPMGSYTEQISYQLVGADSLGINKVCLVLQSVIACIPVVWLWVTGVYASARLFVGIGWHIVGWGLIICQSRREICTILVIPMCYNGNSRCPLH